MSNSIPPPPMPPPPVAMRPRPAPSHMVKASWYGNEFSHHRTATGEKFDPNHLTAASRTLPLGSVVRVTNPDTGRSVKVRINDRGPFKHGVGLDLSRRAAKTIGITKKGVARVKVTPVSGASEAPAAPPD
ncbi:MAG TPA: septal ring lytic transglycosylase RlpA family protein [Candidatus Binataceae bacterium]|nr:septal ring lytic transglycosylase RlpA family protein [Candidatus Binataceae bacterium]